MMITANGAPVVGMRLTLPQSGLWVASLEVDSDEALEGALTLTQAVSGASYIGHIVAAGVVAGTCRLEAVGGSGGLTGELAARSYRDATARTVISELLASVGETLDGTSTRSVMTTALSYWTRAAGRASVALSAVVEALGAQWRILPSGAVWVGSESWPEFVDDDALELDRDARSGAVLVGADAISLTPGVAFNGDRVGRVEHSFGRDEELRTTYWVTA